MSRCLPDMAVSHVQDRWESGFGRRPSGRPHRRAPEAALLTLCLSSAAIPAAARCTTSTDTTASAFHELVAAAIDDLANWQHESTIVSLRRIWHESATQLWARAMAGEHAGGVSAAAEHNTAAAGVAA